MCAVGLLAVCVVVHVAWFHTLFEQEEKRKSGGAVSCIPQPVYSWEPFRLNLCVLGWHGVSCLHCFRGTVVLVLPGEALGLAWSTGSLQAEMTKV